MLCIIIHKAVTQAPRKGSKHRPFLESDTEISSVTLQNDVSFVSPSPTALWEEDGLSKSLTKSG